MTQRPLTDAEQSRIAKGELDVLSNDLFKFNLQQRPLVQTGEGVPHDRVEVINAAKLDEHEDSHGSTEHHRRGHQPKPGDDERSYEEGNDTGWVDYDEDSDPNYDPRMGASHEKLQQAFWDSLGNDETPIDTYQEFEDAAWDIAQKMEQSDPNNIQSGNGEVAQAMLAATLLGQEPTDQNLQKLFGKNWAKTGVPQNVWSQKFEEEDQRGGSIDRALLRKMIAKELTKAKLDEHEDSHGSTEHIAKNELDNPAYEGWSRGPARDPLAKPKPPKPKPIGRR